jgi:hypothetical protein
MSGSAALYQAAIVLIPVLLFGGAVRETGEQQREKNGGGSNGGGKVLGFVLVTSLLAGLVAEFIAIRGAIEPGTIHELGQRFLTGILTFGTAGVAILAAAPLLEKRTGLVQLEPLRIAIVLIVVLGVGQLFIGQSLEKASTHEEVEAVSKRQVESTRSLQSAEERNLIAREHLVEVADEVKQSSRAVEYADALIERLNHARAEVERGLTAQNVIRQLNLAFHQLNEINIHLESDLDQHLPRINSVERDLYLLAEDRLTAAMGLVMSSAANEILAERDLRDICGVPTSSDYTCP